MKKKEILKISLLLFHVFSLLLLFVSTTLLLNNILTNGNNQANEVESFAINIPALLSLLTIFIGIISWLIMVIKWIRKSRLEFYMKSILITKTVLIVGSIVLLFFN